MTKTGPVGQIHLAELSRWYQEKNLEGKKHTVEEWKTTLDYIKARASGRQTSAADTRASASKNRSGVENKMSDMQKEVDSSFQEHLMELGQYISTITEVLNKVKDEINTMTGAINTLEGWIVSRLCLRLPVPSLACAVLPPPFLRPLPSGCTTCFVVGFNAAIPVANNRQPSGREYTIPTPR